MPFQTNINPTNKYYFFALLMIFFITIKAYATNQWQRLSPGIEYQRLEIGLLTPWSCVHVFRIDLSKNKLESISAKDIGEKNASAELFTKRSQALLGMNGGFFDREYHPLGLRINNSKIENPLKPISWWGIFHIKNNKARISSLTNFKQGQGIDFAIQSGPRLLIKGTVPSLKDGKDDRSALGITQKGKVILLVTNNVPMSTKELAYLMQTYPLYCKDAINLDGGSSSQLYADIHSFKLTVHGFSNVSDAIVVKPLG
ncbi:MAG: phosphodiester glycosidase family protein [Legionella sp.]|nr:phosphodiester glycosidase family protein [Legionella sp.]